MRIVFALAAITWTLMLIGYWIGSYTPSPADISFGFIAVILIGLAGALDRN